ncbi:MAG: hypothetical protein NTY95_11740 [Bacteroidia bacterium]|nr:hypothetical protein [Bacteroidia bacterium]
MKRKIIVFTILATFCVMNISAQNANRQRLVNQNELNMSEREMTEAGDKFVDLEVREAALAQEFHTRIKTILSPVKILRLYQAENQFRQQLLNELRDRNQVRNNQNIRQQ